MSRNAAAAGGDQVQLALFPADVKAGDPVSAESYRLIQSPRANMTYDPITNGALGSLVGFTPSKSGKFTRNLVEQGGQLFAEIA